MSNTLIMVLWLGLIPMVIAVVNIICLLACQQLGARLRIVCAGIATCGNILLMGIITWNILQDSRGFSALKDPWAIMIAMTYIIISTTTTIALWMPIARSKNNEHHSPYK